MTSKDWERLSEIVVAGACGEHAWSTMRSPFYQIADALREEAKIVAEREKAAHAAEVFVTPAPDPYALFASTVFARPIDAITAAERLEAKRAVYFLAYGGDAERAALQLDVPQARVEKALHDVLPPVDMAVVAGDGRDGLVLWCCGDAITIFNKEDSPFVSDMRLGVAPHGISIWEGAMLFEGAEGEAIPAPRGKYRLPNDTEWAAVRAGRSPWEEMP